MTLNATLASLDHRDREHRFPGLSIQVVAAPRKQMSQGLQVNLDLRL